MNVHQARREARAMNAGALASRLQVEPTRLRRWIAGGVDTELGKMVTNHLTPAKPKRRKAPAKKK